MHNGMESIKNMLFLFVLLIVYKRLETRLSLLQTVKTDVENFTRFLEKLILKLNTPKNINIEEAQEN